MTFFMFTGRRMALPAMVAAGMLSVSHAALAQVIPGIGDAVRESEQSRQSAPALRPAPVPVLPRLVEPQLALNDKETIVVRVFHIDGPILVNEADIHAILEPYENRKLTIADIYEAADKITTLYRNAGYLVAKAYVPAQNARSGSLRIKIVPGKYGQVELKNQSLVRSDYLQGVMDRVLGASPYIQKDPLERAMLLMSDLAGGGMPHVTMGSGRQPETSDFVFDVPPAPRVAGYLLGDNYGSPFTGRDRFSGGLDINSPLGFGDKISAYGLLSDEAKLANWRVAYSVPIGFDGLRAEAAIFRTTYVLGGIYQDLDATGTADGVSGTLTYALKRQREESVYLAGGFTHKSLIDNILGVPLANRNMDEGTFSITRDTISAFAGLPLSTNTIFTVTAGNVDFPDPVQRAINALGVNTQGQFAKVNLSFLATLGLSENWSLTTTFKGQKSFNGKNLDSSEQMSLTGFYGVRSFDEGLSGDSGYLFTPELKYALPTFGNYRHSVGVFTDVGGVWIENPTYTTTQLPFTQLNDVGLGYYSTYEYSPNRFLMLKAQVARTYGHVSGAALTYDQETKGLVQVGLTF
ncbi:MAG TPA: ShlB/FhaC/HecB family hemolysin secretion/activation protein [Afipia sp.]